MLHGVGPSAAFSFIQTYGRSETKSVAIAHAPSDGHTLHANGHQFEGGATDPSASSTGTGKNDRAVTPEVQPTHTGQGLTEEEQKQVTELKMRDREVRAHEMAHKGAAGQYGGPVSYDYQGGPDGRRYAVGGEVSIDSSSVAGDPEATIQKMQIIARAALAPAQPSGQDRAVAAQAQQTAAQARRDLLAERVKGEHDEDNKEDVGANAAPIGQTVDKIV